MGLNLTRGKRYTAFPSGQFVSDTVDPGSWIVPTGSKWLVKSLNVFNHYPGSDESVRIIDFGIMTSGGKWRSKIMTYFPINYNEGRLFPLNQILRSGEKLRVYAYSDYSSGLTPGSDSLNYMDIYADIEEYDQNEFVHTSVSAEMPITRAATVYRGTATTSVNAYTSYAEFRYLFGVKALTVMIEEQNVNALKATISGSMHANTYYDIVAEYDVAKNATVTKFVIDTATITLPKDIRVQIKSAVGGTHGSFKLWTEAKFNAP